MPMLAASPFLVMAARILVHRGDPVYSGDAGLLAMAVRSAAHGTRTLGPYSRFGFFHPGPVFFYVLVPFEWITANARWGLPFGVAVLNATVAAMLVAIVQRAARSTARELVSGAAAALVVLGYGLAVDVGLLSIFWNPLQIMLPVALLLVSTAYVEGWDWPFAVVMLSATFLVQTHVATVPVAVVGVAAAALFAARGARRRPSAGVSLALGLAVVAWIPPLWQQVTGSPGNLSELVTFFRTSHEPRPGWTRAVAYTGRELAGSRRGSCPVVSESPNSFSSCSPPELLRSWRVHAEPAGNSGWASSLPFPRQRLSTQSARSVETSIGI
jgi:hypothetical protein